MASRLKKQDLCWCLISSLITIVGLYKLPAAQAASPLVIQSCLVGPAASTAVAVLALRRPQLYLATRTALLAMIKVLRFSTVGTLTRAYPHTAQPGYSSADGLAAPATKGLLLLVAGLGWQLPTATTLAVQGVGLALYLATTPERCAFGCSSPAEGVSAGVPASATAIPTQLNTIPHSRETRRFFYREVADAVQQALSEGAQRVAVRCTIPELNTEFDVYRVGTLLELVRELVLGLAADGRRVKVCVQQPLGQGVFQGVPLSLNGVPRIMKQMDWGEATPFLGTGAIGAGEVDGADAFVVVSPQNIVGHSILPFIEEMVAAAEAQGKPMILINPGLGDIPSSAGVMGIRGRQDRQDFIKTFQVAYHFRLLYIGASMYPIMGALRYSQGGEWEVYKRVDLGNRQEEYRIIGTFPQQPGPGEITECFNNARQR